MVRRLDQTEKEWRAMPNIDQTEPCESDHGPWYSMSRGDGGEGEHVSAGMRIRGTGKDE